MNFLSVDHITIDSGCHAPNSRRDGCSGSKLATCVGTYLISKAEHHSGSVGLIFFKNMSHLPLKQCTLTFKLALSSGRALRIEYQVILGRVFEVEASR